MLNQSINCAKFYFSFSRGIQDSIALLHLASKYIKAPSFSLLDTEMSHALSQNCWHFSVDVAISVFSSISDFSLLLFAALVISMNLLPSKMLYLKLSCMYAVCINRIPVKAKGKVIHRLTF